MEVSFLAVTSLSHSAQVPHKGSFILLYIFIDVNLVFYEPLIHGIPEKGKRPSVRTGMGAFYPKKMLPPKGRVFFQSLKFSNNVFLHYYF